jgi:hypothetical protein
MCKTLNATNRDRYHGEHDLKEYSALSRPRIRTDEYHGQRPHDGS